MTVWFRPVGRTESIDLDDGSTISAKYRVVADNLGGVEIVLPVSVERLEDFDDGHLEPLNA